ncbi:MAG TPA: DUF2179 domain-containing protein [Desulfomonilia bacterium]|nr:DUF2179 domain-containing protein [Desulfomonilia bacterium]
MQAFIDSLIYTWVVLPVLIFLARIMDVSLDTVRIIFINRNLKYYAAAIGFFEVMIWLMAIRQIIQHLGSPFCFIAYAAGFATGNYVGILIENRLSIGKVIIRIIARRESDDLILFLRSAGYGLTIIEAQGVTGPVKVIFSIVERSNITHIVELIKQHNPQAFYSVEDVRFVSEAVTPYRLPGPRRWERFVSRMRKKEE